MTWRIRINNVETYCVIGIDEGNKNVDDRFFDSVQSRHYALSADDGKKRSHVDKGDFVWMPFSDPFGDGDIVCMQLDMRHHTLSFGINDGKMEIAFKDVESTEIGYSLAVYLYDKG